MKTQNEIREIMIKEYEKRKDELDVVKFNSETRAFVVSGLDLIYKYMKSVLKQSGLKPMIEEL